VIDRSIIDNQLWENKIGVGRILHLLPRYFNATLRDWSLARRRRLFSLFAPESLQRPYTNLTGLQGLEMTTQLLENFGRTLIVMVRNARDVPRTGFTCQIWREDYTDTFYITFSSS
jgi:hypothetical protein